MFFVEHNRKNAKGCVKDKKSNSRIHFIGLYPELIDEDTPFLMLKINSVKSN